MSINLVTGSDPRLVSDKVSEITRELIKSMATKESRSTILETHDAGAANSQDREDAIRKAVASAETMSLFGEERVVVIREISEATVAELSSLVAYLAQPSDSTHLVVSATGKLPKSIADALKRAGATTLATTPPDRRQELVTWFLERLGESGLTLELSALNQIIDWLGEDQARLPGLIDILVSTYGTLRKLTSDDITPFLGDAGSVKPWDLTDAIDAGDSATAIDMLHRMTRSGEYHPLQVMALLHTHYTKLMRLDGPDLNSPQDAMSIIGSKSEFQAKKYLNQYRRLGGEGINQAVQLLARADVDLRGGKDLGEELTMEILIARLCRMGATNKSSRTTSPKRR
ncbi:MAG: DNA polymerase III subunit delta [Actinobacteria bacterium]|nr:DNA polymerase III subunit delta [Actinomycetota bacterium]MDA3016958.1 DNA polymerase III subunit delta [Actinomycetota bacterium]